MIKRTTLRVLGRKLSKEDSINLIDDGEDEGEEHIEELWDHIEELWDHIEVLKEKKRTIS